MVAAYPMIGLFLAIGVWIYASRKGDRALRTVAICLTVFFVLVLVQRLVVPGETSG
jgi:uncharacterized membrane protein YhfC